MYLVGFMSLIIFLFKLQQNQTSQLLLHTFTQSNSSIIENFEKQPPININYNQLVMRIPLDIKYPNIPTIKKLYPKKYYKINIFSLHSNYS